MKHTPDSAARAVRVLLEDDIAETWEQDWERKREIAAIPPAQRGFSGRWANSYKALLLVREQCGGGYSSRQIMCAIERHMPELFAEYWETLVTDWELLDRTCRA